MTGTHCRLLTIQNHLQRTRDDIHYLLVNVRMGRNHTTFRQADSCDGDAGRVNHLSGDQWGHLLNGDLAPVVCGHKRRYSNN